MNKTIGYIGLTAGITLLSGCQSLNHDLGQVNNGLATLNGQAPATTPSTSTPSTHKKHIHNSWHVSDRDALLWLKQNHVTWSDHGKLKDVNWYDFWSQQIHAKTALATQAYQYCHKAAWQTPKPGANCQTYWQAYSMTHAQESQTLGNQLEASA